jgi:hypothetical protein
VYIEEIAGHIGYVCYTGAPKRSHSSSSTTYQSVEGTTEVAANFELLPDLPATPQSYHWVVTADEFPPLEGITRKCRLEVQAPCAYVAFSWFLLTKGAALSDICDGSIIDDGPEPITNLCEPSPASFLYSPHMHITGQPTPMFLHNIEITYVSDSSSIDPSGFNAQGLSRFILAKGLTDSL